MVVGQAQVMPLLRQEPLSLVAEVVVAMALLVLPAAAVVRA